MPPFNQLHAPPSSGRSSGRYRRRIVPLASATSPDHATTYSSNSAITAAELAASSIVSDTTITTTTNNNNNNNNNAQQPKNKISTSSSSSSSTVLQNLRASRARLMQRNNYQVREERWFKLKAICLGIVFVIGLFWIGGGGGGNNSEDNDNIHLNQADHQRNVNHSGSSERLRVPPPPSNNFHDENKASNFRHRKHSENKQPPKVIRSSVANYASNVNKASSSNTATIVHHHQHVIPPFLTFTYHTNLLTTPHSQLTDSEDIALSQNVHEITALHPDSQIHFLNDNDCLKSIQSTLGPSTNLTKYFSNEKHGMYKADICRGAALYETGGLYFDIDVETRSIPLWDVIAPQTEFVTTLVHKDSNHIGGFFQAFIGVVPNHPVMKRYLELFVEYYEGKLSVDGPLGVYFLRMAYDEIINEKDKDTKTELWQEVRYSPTEFPEIHRSRWGTRRACQMMVVAPQMKRTSSVVGGGGFERKERMVPIFSHANGSRMCGGKDTTRNGNSDTA